MNSPETSLLNMESEKKSCYQPKKKQQQFIESISSVVEVSPEDESIKKSYDKYDENINSDCVEILLEYMNGKLGEDSINWDDIAIEIVNDSSILYLLSQKLYKLKGEWSEGMNEAQSDDHDTKTIKKRAEYIFTNIKDIVIAMLASNRVSFLENTEDFYWHENILKEVISLTDAEEKRLLIKHLEKIGNPRLMLSQLIHKQTKIERFYTDEDDSFASLIFIKFMFDNESVAYQDQFKQMLSAKGISPIEISDMMDKGYTSISDQAKRILKTLDEILAFEYEYYGGDISVSFLKNELGRVFSVPRTLFESWRFNHSSDKASLITRLGFMEQIEMMAKGGVQLLYDNYGLCEFNRYPLGMLIDQINKHDEQIPYGVIIFPKSDHNDAFDHDVDVLFSLYKQVYDEYHIRFFECGNGQDLYRSLIYLNDKYGKENKISFMILGGHGQVNSIQLGDDHISSGSFTSIEKDMVTDSRGLNRIRDYFVPSPQIVLFSCSTGLKGGIAEELANKLGARVVAPRVPTSPKSIKFTESEGGRINLDVKYNDGDEAALYVGK
jgi:hypothetical protein